MPKKYQRMITPGESGQRLDQVLGAWLPEALRRPVSKAKARKLIVAGAVYLNGKRVRIASKTLLAGARLEVYVDEARLFDAEGPAGDIRFELTAARVLFEDSYLIVVDKPAGLPTQPTLDEARDCLFAAVKRFLIARDGAIDPYLALHHRLDRDTSGVIALVKSRDANAGMADAFAGRLARKTYQALSSCAEARRLGSEWVVKNHVGRLPGREKRARYGAVRSGGDPAETRFRLLERFTAAASIEASPLTGRTHQIRVHLAEADLPILGDPLYGAGPLPHAPRLMLHAARLTFPHPVHQTEVSVESKLPEDFLRCIRWLRSNQRV